MGLPRAPLRREAQGLERGFEVRGDPTDGLGAFDADPDHVHPRETRERPGSSNGDWERLHVRARLTDRRHDFGDEAFLRVAQELHRQVQLVRGDDLEPPCVRKKVQGRYQEDERAQGGGGDADDLLQDGSGRREDGADPGEGQGDRREEVVPHPAIHAAPAPQSTTRVPRNGSPRIADRSAAGSRPWTTLNGVRSRATTRAATGSNTMLGPAASWPFPARSMRSRKLIRSSSRAFGSFRGSVVYTPATEVAFTMRAARTKRASDALTRSVASPARA